VDSLGSHIDSSLNDSVHVQIAVLGSGRSYANGLVSDLSVERAPVGGGINGDAANSQLTAGSDYPDSDLSSVSDQNFFEH